MLFCLQFMSYLADVGRYGNRVELAVLLVGNITEELKTGKHGKDVFIKHFEGVHKAWKLTNLGVRRNI